MLRLAVGCYGALCVYLLCLEELSVMHMTDFVVQERRYDLVEEFGCDSTALHTALHFILIETWPLLLGGVSLMYCCESFSPLFLDNLRSYQLWFSGTFSSDAGK